MKVEALSGVQVLTYKIQIDKRGSFRRIFDISDLKSENLNFVQSSLSKNFLKGTVRGLHFQTQPSVESKLVSCIKGRICDVLVDVRPSSKTYGSHMILDLREDEPTGLLIPPGIAHGFQTLEDDTFVLYQMTDFFVPTLAVSLQWNDENLAIEWPLPCTNISESDALGKKWPVSF